MPRISGCRGHRKPVTSGHWQRAGYNKKRISATYFRASVGPTTKTPRGLLDQSSGSKAAHRTRSLTNPARNGVVFEPEPNPATRGAHGLSEHVVRPGSGLRNTDPGDSWANPHRCASRSRIRRREHPRGCQSKFSARTQPGERRPLVAQKSQSQIAAIWHAKWQVARILRDCWSKT